MSQRMTRREALKETTGVVAAIAAVATAGEAPPQAAPNTLPAIRLGDLAVSRLILGSNPFFGFTHGNPQATDREMREFYTEDRIMAVLDQAADHGITAVWTPCYDHWIRLWNRYREKGGKLRIWIGQPDHFDQMKGHISACAKNGGKAICIQGECIDRAFREGRHDLVREWLDLVKSFGLPAGMASHRAATHLVAEEKKFPTDFYHQCLYQPDDYARRWWEQAVATIRQLPKPVVAYKVLAAGRIAPREAFNDLFRQLRPKDGLCIGVCPSKDPRQIAELAALTRDLTAAT